MSLREHLQAIYDEHGRLTPELVVDEARPKNHPLHAHVFDRAPKEAAEAWYRSRAQEMIRTAKVRYRAADGDDHAVRAFHSVRRPDDGYVYVPLDEVVEDQFTREMVLRDMEREWRALHARYRHLEEYLNLVARTIEEEVTAA